MNCKEDKWKTKISVEVAITDVIKLINYHEDPPPPPMYLFCYLTFIIRESLCKETAWSKYDVRNIRDGRINAITNKSNRYLPAFHLRNIIRIIEIIKLTFQIQQNHSIRLFNYKLRAQRIWCIKSNALPINQQLESNSVRYNTCIERWLKNNPKQKRIRKWITIHRKNKNKKERS
jgi:hypothetical protein